MLAPVGIKPPSFLHANSAFPRLSLRSWSWSWRWSWWKSSTCRSRRFLVPQQRGAFRDQGCGGRFCFPAGRLDPELTCKLNLEVMSCHVNCDDMTIDYIPVTVILMMSNNCRRLISDLVWASPTPWQWKGWGSIQCIDDNDVKKSKRLFRGKNVSRGPAAGVLVSLYLWRSCLQLRFYPGWRMISSNAWMVSWAGTLQGAWMVICEVQTGNVRCKVSSSPLLRATKAPPFNNTKARKLPILQKYFVPKKRKKVNDVLPWPSIGRTSVSCAKEICDVKHHQLLFHAEKVPIRWHKSWKIDFNICSKNYLMVHFPLWT